jgi:hypothetical protein
MNQLLDYLTTYPDNGTTYCTSDMILSTHANAGFHNKSRGRSQASADIFVSKNNPFPKHNGPVLSISQIKFVMSSAAKAELGALYTTAKEMVPLHQNLIKMGWPQPCMPIQMDNFTAVVATNLTVVPQKTKSMDLRLWWLRCRESQQEFRYYWYKGSHNWADYHTKHHSPIYHEANRPIHAGAAAQLPLTAAPFRPRCVYPLTNTPARCFFLSLQTKLRMSLQGCIVYLLLMYGANTHEACSSDPVLLVTRNPFTPLLGREWIYIATVHSSSHLAITQASDQLHTTSFSSPPVLSNTHNSRDTQNTQSLSLLVMCRP